LRLVRRPTSPLADMPREVVVLAAVAFAVAVGFGILIPVITVFAVDEFGVTVTAASAVISAFALMRFVASPLGGRLVDRLGERLVLATGIGIVAVSSALAGLAQNYVQLLVLRGIGGIGSAMFTVSAFSLLVRVAGPHQRGRAAGLFQGGFLVGGISGPAFGGILAGISLRLPFFVYAGTLAVAGAIGMLFLSRTHLADRAAADADVQRTRLFTALRNRAYVAAVTTNLGTGWVLFGARSALVPLFVVEGLRQGPVWTGIGLLVSAATQAVALLPAGRFVDTVGRKPGMVFGSILAAASLLVLAASTTITAFLISMALFGVASGFLGVGPSAVVGDVVAGGRGGSVVAAFQMASDLGAIIGPLVAGWLVEVASTDEVTSFGLAWASCAGIFLVSALLAAVAPETRPRSAPAAATPPRSAS
jgi:MFS family permease